MPLVVLVMMFWWVMEQITNYMVAQVMMFCSAAAVTGAFNATPTIHQGIEAGLNTRLWENPQGDQVRLRQVYTLNDFYYRNDDTFGDNQLPGIPKHVYQGELQYQHHSGWYSGVNERSRSGRGITRSRCPIAKS